MDHRQWTVNHSGKLFSESLQVAGLIFMGQFGVSVGGIHEPNSAMAHPIPIEMPKVIPPDEVLRHIITKYVRNGLQYREIKASWLKQIVRGPS